MALKCYSDEDALKLFRDIDVDLHDGLEVKLWGAARAWNLLGETEN